jgi:hypothetical protein
MQNVSFKSQPIDSHLIGGMVSFHEGHLMMLIILDIFTAVFVFLKLKRAVYEFDSYLHHRFNFQHHSCNHFFCSVRVPLVALSILKQQVLSSVDHLCFVDCFLQHQVGVSLYVLRI